MRVGRKYVENHILDRNKAHESVQHRESLLACIGDTSCVFLFFRKHAGQLFCLS